MSGVIPLLGNNHATRLSNVSNSIEQKARALCSGLLAEVSRSRSDDVTLVVAAILVQLDALANIFDPTPEGLRMFTYEGPGDPVVQDDGIVVGTGRRLYMTLDPDFGTNDFGLDFTFKALTDLETDGQNFLPFRLSNASGQLMQQNMIGEVGVDVDSVADYKYGATSFRRTVTTNAVSHWSAGDIVTLQFTFSGNTTWELYNGADIVATHVKVGAVAFGAAVTELEFSPQILNAGGADYEQVGNDAEFILQAVTLYPNRI